MNRKLSRNWLRGIGATLLVAEAAVFVMPLSAQPPAPVPPPLAPPISAPPAPPAPAVKVQAHQVQGQVVQVSPGEFVIKTKDDRRIIVAIGPQTKFLMNDRVVQASDLRVGTDVSITLVPPSEKEVAQTVTLFGPPAAVPANEQVIEGVIVRTVGTDQVLVRTADGREVTVFVDPATRYMFENRVGAYTDLRAGANIRVNANVHEGRHMARQILVPAGRRQ